MKIEFVEISYSKRSSSKKEPKFLLENIPVDQVEGSVVISLRSPAHSWKTKVRSRHLKIDASDRISLPGKKYITLAYIQTDSSLHPLIFWDIFHSSPVGTKYTVIEGIKGDFWKRRYFSDCIEIDEEFQENGAFVLRFTKSAPALVERSPGLDGWTFAIPAGPGDATALNACVGQILNLHGLSEKQFEIIVCGNPGNNFLYRENVRLIADPTSGGEINLSVKKNALAENARYENLCILHDRVILPKTFFREIDGFGDFFPFIAFPSLFFFDKHQYCGQRYSDYNTVRVRTDQPIKVPSDKVIIGENYTLFDRDAISLVGDQFQFGCLDLFDYADNSYITGSLYICKTELWKFCNQNERLPWECFEDVEHGMRALYRCGIPQRIVATTYTQSLYPRSGLMVPNGVLFASHDWSSYSERPLALARFGKKMKPLLKITDAEAKQRMGKFIDTYLERRSGAALKAKLENIDLRGVERFDIIKSIINHVDEKKISSHQKFIREFESGVIFETLEVMSLSSILNLWRVHGSIGPVRERIMSNWTILCQYILTNTRRSKIFMDGYGDFFPEPGVMTTIGSIAFSLYASVFRRRELSLRGGFMQTLRAVMSSRPSL